VKPSTHRDDPSGMAESPLTSVLLDDALAAAARPARPSFNIPASRARASAGVIKIVPAGRWPQIDLPELWAYRELLLFLVWRDVKVRYAQTVLGAGWVILQPILTMAVFTVVFGKLARIPSDGIPYAVFSLAALVPWNYFAGAVTGASNSLISNSNLITKVYFPRLVIPLASVLGGLVNFAIVFGLFLMIVLAFGIVPSPSAVLLVPLLLLLMMLAAAGVGCWFAALAIQYRDIAGVAAFVVQAWMYASPVVYPLSLVPRQYRSIYLLNPMAGVIDGFRAVVLGSTPLSWPALAVSAGISMLLFMTGVLYFRRLEHVFADVA